MADKCLSLIQVADLASAEEGLLQQAQLAAVNLRHGRLLLARIAAGKAGEHRYQLLSISVELAKLLYEIAKIVGSEPLDPADDATTQRFSCCAGLLTNGGNVQREIRFTFRTTQPIIRVLHPLQI